MAGVVTAGAAFSTADMVLPLFEGNKKGAVRPGVPDQERMDEGLNKESADGADTELEELAEVALIAINEVHVESEDGGALRTRPVVAIVGEHFGAVQPALIQLGSGW